MKLCKKCNKTKNFFEFSKDASKLDGYRHTCRECRNTQRRENRKANPEKFLKYERLPEVKLKEKNNVFNREYGISLLQYNEMLQQQGNVCKICQLSEYHKTKKNLTIDHCHKTGRVRGLLCHRCNCLIGLGKEKIENFERVITYLKGEK